MIELTPALLAQIDERFPGSNSLLVVGDIEAPAFDVGLTGPCTGSEVLETDFQQRFDLGLVIEPEPSDVAVIARLRDVACRRVLLLPGSTSWPDNDLRGLGFQRVESLDSHATFLHDSDLLNQPREWNNARHWANPENFDKYRW